MRFIAAVAIAVLMPVLAFAGPSIVGDMNGWNQADPAYDTAVNGNGVHVLTKTLVAGSYGYKAIESDTWGDDFPGPNQNFTLGAGGDVTWFVNFGANLGVKEGDEFVFDSLNPPTVAGDFQDEVGNPGDWDPASAVTEMSDPDLDDVWEYSAIIPAGNYQGKVTLNKNWDQDTQMGGGNVSFSSDGVATTTFTYDMSNNTTTVSSQLVTAQDVTVTFTLCLTNGIDSFFDVCVTGGHPALTSWGAGVLMSQPCPIVSPKLYTVDVMFPAGSDPFVEYKYKKDDCATWESTGNHTFNIDDSAPFQDLWVDGWEYGTPDCPDCASSVEDASWGIIKGLYR
ncbi:MAG: carbohydrate-binding module family 20 domain-containing protein [Candidatus Eisenbacteria bacterium]